MKLISNIRALLYRSTAATNLNWGLILLSLKTILL